MLHKILDKNRWSRFLFKGIFFPFLLQVFDKEECTQLFMTHFNTPFTGLLVLPEANMAGRAAALCIFGNLLEFGSPLTRRQIASEVVPVVLLYGRCNDLPSSLISKIQSNLSIENEDVYDDDVDRVQQAAYCLGVIAVTAPQVLIENFDATMTTVGRFKTALSQ